MTAAAENPEFPFLANRLCLDFVNTELLDGGQVRDLLGDFAGLLRWAGAAGLVTPAQAKELAGKWADRAEAKRAWQQAARLRRELRDTAARLAAGRPAPPEAMEHLNALLHSRVGYLELLREDGRYVQRFRARLERPEDLLAPIAESAAGLLSHDDPALLRKCEAGDCVLYFYDTTRNHRRRWCRMDACGNRAKVAAHYRRQRQGGAEG